MHLPKWYCSERSLRNNGLLKVKCYPWYNLHKSFRTDQGVIAQVVYSAFNIMCIQMGLRQTDGMCKSTNLPQDCICINTSLSMDVYWIWHILRFLAYYLGCISVFLYQIDSVNANRFYNIYFVIPCNPTHGIHDMRRSHPSHKQEPTTHWDQLSGPREMRSTVFTKCNFSYEPSSWALPKTHLKLKSRKIAFDHDVRFNNSIVFIFVHSSTVSRSSGIHSKSAGDCQYNGPDSSIILFMVE